MNCWENVNAGCLWIFRTTCSDEQNVARDRYRDFH